MGGVKMNYPKITIITPSFNQGQYIEQTIRSVLHQNYPNLEYIIIDGGSTDNTVEVIKKYEKHIAYWISEPYNGQAHAINKGLSHATGDIFNWINSDDYLESGCLQFIGHYFVLNPETEALCGYTRCFFQSDGSHSHTYRMGLKNTPTRTLLNVEMNQPGTFYAMPVITQLGGINESLRYVFDNELWMRYLCMFGINKVALTNQLFAHFRLHGNSKSVADGFEKFNDEQIQVMHHIALQAELAGYLQNLLTTQPIHYQTQPWDLKYLNINAFRAWFANMYMLTLWNMGLKKEAKKCVWQSIRYRYFKLNRRNILLLIKSSCLL